MAAKTIKRWLYHGDSDERKDEHVDPSGLDALSEPLLGNSDYDERHSEVIGDKDQQDNQKSQKQEHVSWAKNFSRLIAQFARWIKRFFSLVSISQHKPSDQKFPGHLSTLQEERLTNLTQRLKVIFDSSRGDHQDALKELWRLAYPHREPPPLKSELWKEMGWQGPDPSTDFRGAGFISLENLIFFAKKYPESFQRLLHKQDGKRSDWEYPFAAAGVNISFMLTQMLGLQSGAPTSRTRDRFLELLGADETAFDNLYCIAFQLLDSQWLSKCASYMEFNEVLTSTRTQLEDELALEDISSIEDLPAYSILNRHAQPR